MRARAMHPLCCIAIDSPWISDPDPEPAAGAPDNADGSDVVVAGVLHKWTHFGRGWRSRWFSLRNGVLTYAKIQSPPKDNPDPDLDPPPLPEDVRLIGSTPTARSLIGIQQQQKTIGFVYLKVSSFRESKSDDRRFYIFSPTKTLHLRTGSKEDRVAWIEALVSARSKFSLYDKLSLVQNDASFSTTKLRDRMQSEGLGQAVIKDCEQIMQSEFSEFQRQLKLCYEEHLHLVGTFRQHLENVNVGDETRSIREGQLQLMKHEFSSSGRGKYSEYCTTESSEDVEKQELDDSSDEEPCFYDTKEGFPESHGTNPSTLFVSNHTGAVCRSENHLSDPHIMHTEREPHVMYAEREPHVMYAEREHTEPMLSYIERRKELPQPIEKEKAANLWSVIKDNVGKDLTRVCLPVYFNEPLSSLQKCFEDLEYSHLLDQAYEYGKMGNSLMRILNIAAFAVSGYASSEGRPCKPFNPLLGETYEADFPEKGIRFFSEKVSHHPMLIACHCEGKGWKFWGDSNLRSKFWGRSIQLDPVGVLTLEFADGEIFQWSKVTTSIYNLILGKVYCDHHGTMSIQGNREYSCKLKFKERSLFDRNPRQVQGFMEDTMGNKLAALVGKWDDSLYYVTGHDVSKTKGCISTENATLLWRRSKPPENPTRYNLSSFAITLNELTSGLQEKLPPTDSRLRPDQRYLENGEYEKAFAEKLRLETRQRMSCKLQENGWKPRWFQKDTETGTFRYMGGYWEASEQKKWEDCPDIFGEFSVDLNTTCD